MEGDAKPEALQTNGNYTGNREAIEEEVTERKLTQTDHLNKQLLNSFLDRLNQQSTASGGQSPEQEDSADWETEELDKQTDNSH